MPRDRIVIENPPEGFPPLMLIARRRLTPEAIDSIKAALSAALEQRKPFVIEPDFDVFQLVNSQWTALS